MPKERHPSVAEGSPVCITTKMSLPAAGAQYCRNDIALGGFPATRRLIKRTTLSSDVNVSLATYPLQAMKRDVPITSGQHSLKVRWLETELEPSIFASRPQR
jgi:hypothetical protein